MIDSLSPRNLQRLYKEGQNISKILSQQTVNDYPKEKVIEISYDLQTGSYIEAQKLEHISAHTQLYTKKLAQTIQSLCGDCSSILEAGIGEATTLSRTLEHLSFKGKAYGFDLSWSRIAYADRWLKSNELNNVTLCTGDMFKTPFANNSIDIVYTSHAIEPNGGREKQILQELFRVTRRYLILLEPSYELANAEAKARMDSFGYCKNLAGFAKELGYKVLTHELYPHIVNPLNPTALTILEKTDIQDPASYQLACPIYKTPLVAMNGSLYSEEALVAYPILAGIPCLRPENGIVASKLEEF